jgi:hypothetical protein
LRTRERAAKNGGVSTEQNADTPSEAIEVVSQHLYDIYDTTSLTKQQSSASHAPLTSSDKTVSHEFSHDFNAAQSNMVQTTTRDMDPPNAHAQFPVTGKMLLTMPDPLEDDDNEDDDSDDAIGVVDQNVLASLSNVLPKVQSQLTSEQRKARLERQKANRDKFWNDLREGYVKILEMAEEIGASNNRTAKKVLLKWGLGGTAMSKSIAVNAFNGFSRHKAKSINDGKFLFSV